MEACELTAITEGDGSAEVKLLNVVRSAESTAGYGQGAECVHLSKGGTVAKACSDCNVALEVYLLERGQVMEFAAGNCADVG